MITSRSVFLTLVLTLAGSYAVAGTRVYKTVDADGNVIFTDVPPANPTAPLEINEPNAFSSSNRVKNERIASERRRPVEIDEIDDEEETHPGYESLSITSPETDAAIRENAGNVTISLRLSPALNNSEHTLEVLLDDTVVASGSQSDVQLNNIDRGTHTVSARVIDANGNELIAASPVTFHMLRYSALQRKRSAP